MDEAEFNAALLELAKRPVQSLARSMEELLALIDVERHKARLALEAATNEKEILDASVALGYWGGADFIAQKIIDVIHGSIPK